MNTMDVELEEFETHDIYLAAYLKLSGCELIRRRKAGPRVYFIFHNVAGPASDLREAYYSNKAQVPANRFAQEIVNFKQLCFDP